MTLREFRCLECGRFTFVYFDEFPTDDKMILRNPPISCAFCSDDVLHVADHNLTLSDFPKLDSVKAL